MSLVAIIPFRSLDQGKSRLAVALSHDLRSRLCQHLLLRTMRIAAGVARVLVVSDDPRAAAVVQAACRDATFLQASRPGELNRALDEARNATSPGQHLVIVPIDLPFLDIGTLRRFVAAEDSVAIAADRPRQGTNLLFLPGAAKTNFCFGFGPGSFGHHVAEARRLGSEPRICHSMRTAFDLDTPADLAQAGRHATSVASCLRGAVHP